MKKRMPLAWEQCGESKVFSSLWRLADEGGFRRQLHARPEEVGGRPHQRHAERPEPVGVGVHGGRAEGGYLYDVRT